VTKRSLCLGFTRLRPELRRGLPSVASAKEGFTLVELLLFAGIISIMAGAIIGFSLVSSNVAVHNERVSEVEQNGDLILQRIIRAVETSSRIAHPLSGVTGGELLLDGGQADAEVFFSLHGERMAIAVDGEQSHLTTGDVIVDNLSFLHFGTTEAGEGVSVVFRVRNRAGATGAGEGQYTKTFRGTATLPPGGCTVDADCSGMPVPFRTCCDGLCRADCDCASHSDCPAGQICCTEGGDASCQTAAACSPPQCLTVADCPQTAPICDLAACNYKIPSCDANLCGWITIGVCPQCSYCGDGRMDSMSGEQCDDGNTVNTDGCTATCTLPYCGDAILQLLGYDQQVGGGDDEECDDGNFQDGDGCAVGCVNEDLCGSGNEECNDGNAVDTDTCDNSCRLTRCGDGTVQNPNGQGIAEECDDGNTIVGDACSPSCLNVTDVECGNGQLDPGEDCDDGRRCSVSGNPCVFNQDCEGGADVCRGMNIDGCTTPNGCVPPGIPEVCTDLIDNDCDLLVDCADVAGCPNGTGCGANGRQCSSGACVCPGGEANEITCNDSLDNDCDGPIDCADTDCNGLTCGAGQTCVGGSCQAGGGCGNGILDAGEGCEANAHCSGGTPVCDVLGGCVCVASNSCGSCNECPTIIDTWSISIDPISGTCSTGGTACVDLDGSFTLNEVNVDCDQRDCGYCFAGNTGLDCETGINAYRWNIKYDTTGDWVLTSDTSADDEAYMYVLSTPTFDCDGPNIFNKVLTLECSGWPDTITATPVGTNTVTCPSL